MGELAKSFGSFAGGFGPSFAKQVQTNRAGGRQQQQLDQQAETARQKQLKELGAQALEKMNSLKSTFSGLVTAQLDQIDKTKDPVRQQQMRVDLEKESVKFRDALNGLSKQGNSEQLNLGLPNEVENEAFLITELKKLTPKEVGAVKAEIKAEETTAVETAKAGVAAEQIRADRTAINKDDSSDRFAVIRKADGSMVRASDMEPVDESQFFITKDVGVVAQTLGGAGIGTSGAGLRDKIQADLTSVRIGKNINDSLLNAMIIAPERFGVPGAIRAGAETVAGIAKDLAQESFKFLGMDVKGVVDTLNKAITEDPSSDKVKKQLLTKTTAGQVEVFEKMMTFSIARALQPQGKLLATTIESAKGMADLKGLKSSTRIRERLETIQNTFLIAEEGLLKRLGDAGGSPIEISAGFDSGASDVDAEINRILRIP